ncbi:amino acid adenylation domain-containing protein [[Clostridium] colinum]|uniref:amino acid adenylation domain-containing protein n=1 Tax=[Clostridium] colinum TaxID=36835 RepID=UPI0020255723|nr:amino acid adenylation domain-containing protein [[Clostridium] colinum]
MKNIIEYLENSIKKYSNKICIKQDSEQITFNDLRNKARKLGSLIGRKNLFKSPIVVFMDKSINAIVSFLGVAYSGNFYIPIDIEMPSNRIKKILNTLNSKVIVTTKDNFENIKCISGEYDIIYIEDIINEIEDEELLEYIQSKCIDTDLLYVLFTSGSTGEPKGVTISHKSVIDYIEWVTKTFKISDNDIFGNQAPFYFDNSILDIYCTIKCGSTLDLIPKKLFSFPIELLNYIENRKINTIFWVPTALIYVANLKALDKVNVTTLNKILFCGEVMPNKHLNLWRNKFKDCLFANLYGPTEITDVCTYYIIDRPFSDNEPLPIGIPCENTDIFILNEDNELINNSFEIGELYIRGTSLSFGYYNNIDKTNENFIQNPLNSSYREIVYKTGDLVKYNEYNELLFVCRKDSQIKHRGFRIELGEIEAIINSVEEIKQCCCLYDDERKKIVLFYSSDIDINNSTFKDILPEYMIPNKFIKLDNFPLTLNGKINRLELKQYF